MSNKAFNNWGEYKEALLEGLSSKNADIVGSLLENTHTENAKLGASEGNEVIVEAAAANATGFQNITAFDMMFMPLVRRVMPALMATELVGIQPLQASRGIVRTIRTRYADETKQNGAGAVVTDAGDEASGENLYSDYSKLTNTGVYNDLAGKTAVQQSAYLESNRGKAMSLDVVTDQVNTMSRKLTATYSLEAADDLSAYDGLDIEAELTQSLGDEIMRELDREIIDELTTLAGVAKGFDFALADGRYAGEKLAGLAIAIDNLSASIAMKTKKAGASWIVVSQAIFTGLKNASNGSFVPAQAGQFDVSSSLFVGTLGGTVKVFVDPYMETDSVLMGYKGSELDAGLIYTPYIPLSSSGVMRDVQTGDNRIMLRSRYGLYKATNPTTSLGNGADYYAALTVSNLNLGFVA